MPVVGLGRALRMLPAALTALLLAQQQMPIVPANPSAPQSGGGGSGFVQAPIPRGLGNQQPLAGGTSGTGMKGNQPGTSAQAPISSALPGPAGIAPGEPRR